MERTKIASKLKPPTPSTSFVTKMPLREVPTNATASTTVKTHSTTAFSSLAAKRARRSKSFCVSTIKSTIRSTIKPSVSNTNLANKNATSSRAALTKAPITRTNGASSQSSLAKSAVKRPAEAPKASVSAPKLSKFDYKGRFGLLEEKHKILVSSHKDLKCKVDELEEENINFKRVIEEQTESLIELEPYKVSTGELHEQLKQAKVELQHSQQCAQETNDKLVETTKKCNNLKLAIDALNGENAKLISIKESLEDSLSDMQKRSNVLRAEHTELQTEHAKLKSDFTSLQGKYETSEYDNRQLKDSLTDALQSIEEFKRIIHDHETLRRRLHNDVQDLKGNIRVFCRVRPLKADEGDRMPCNMDFLDDTTLELKKSRESTMGRDKSDCKAEFSFDKVFSGKSTQAEVFEDLAQLVQSTLDGYNVCVFAYGQTGSGKTFTMLGSGEHSGMIPRSVDLLFSKIAELEKLDWSFEVNVNFLEIYNETIKDLLNPDSKKPHEIMHNDGKGSMVTNVRTESITSALDMKKLMIKANSNRAIAATNYNLHSSRSHAVTKICVHGFYDRNEFSGSLNLVDLAGSESAKHSDRMTETKSINKSLSALGTVMLALHNKEKHVPYRNSKLTYLLQSSLGGNSKTLMFVNISPLEDCYNETVNSLRFASKVKEVKTGSKRNRTVNKCNYQ